MLQARAPFFIWPLFMSTSVQDLSLLTSKVGTIDLHVLTTLEETFCSVKFERVLYLLSSSVISLVDRTVLYQNKRKVCSLQKVSAFCGTNRSAMYHFKSVDWFSRYWELRGHKKRPPFFGKWFKYKKMNGNFQLVKRKKHTFVWSSNERAYYVVMPLDQPIYIPETGLSRKSSVDDSIKHPTILSSRIKKFKVRASLPTFYYYNHRNDDCSLWTHFAQTTSTVYIVVIYIMA